MLKGSLGLLAAAIGLDAAGAASAGAAPSPRTLQVFSTDLSSKANGRAHGRPVRPDDQLATHARLVERPGGAPIGTFVATALVVRSPFAESLATVEQHVFVLRHGTVTGAGQAVAGEGTFAITGGTGRYAGARGSYSAGLSPHGLGGDGTAHFHFSFTA